MAIDWSSQLYLPQYSVFARPVTVYPVISQPDIVSYAARGIYDTEPVDVLAEEGSVFSDQRVVLDILEAEFSVLPLQGDELEIPADSGMADLGRFKILETKTNGGGETSLSLQRVMAAAPE